MSNVQSVSLFKSELCDTFPHLPLGSAPEVHKSQNLKMFEEGDNPIKI